MLQWPFLITFCSPQFLIFHFLWYFCSTFQISACVQEIQLIYHNQMWFYLLLLAFNYIGAANSFMGHVSWTHWLITNVVLWSALRLANIFLLLLLALNEIQILALLITIVRPIARIFRRGVTWMYDVYVYMHKHERLGGSGGMLPQEIFLN